MDLEPVQPSELAGGQRHTAGECSLGAVFEGEDAGGAGVDALGGEGGNGLYFFGFFAEHPQNLADGIAAQVIRAAAKGFPAHADIFKGIIGGDEGGFHVAKLAQLFHVFLHGLNDGAVQIGEGFHQDYAVFMGTPEHFFRFFGVHCQGLFAQHMLLGHQRFLCPFQMQLVGQGDIDGLHVFVREQFIVAAIGLFKAKLIFECFGFFQGSAGNGVQFAVFGLLHTGNGAALGDIGGAQHAPFDLTHAFFLLTDGYFHTICLFHPGQVFQTGFRIWPPVHRR